MFFRVRALLFGVLATLCVAAMARDARACSVCLAGDPIFWSQGASAQQAGTFSVYLQARGWNKTSGQLPHEEGGLHFEAAHMEEAHGEGEEPGDEGHAEEGFHLPELPGKERNSSQRVELLLGWTPFDRFSLTANIPWAINSITEVEGTEKTTSSLHGLGDIELHASGVLWRSRDVLPDTWIEGRGFVKFPSGRSTQKVNGLADPHLQAGTGSWDFGFGLAGVHRLSWGSLFTSTSFRLNGPGSLKYRYGDVFLANAGIDVPLGHALGCSCLDPVNAGFELNFRWAESDKFRGQTFEDSGGSILYLTPSLRYKLPWPWERGAPSLRAAVQIPATSAWLRGFQIEYPIWLVGLGAAF